MLNMKRIAGLLCVSMVVAVSGCTTLQYASAWRDVNSASCFITPTPGNAASGLVTFKDIEDGLLVVAEISGLTPNQKHGFHVHQLGYSGSSDATCTKGHYDPDGTGFHALPGFDGDHHAGDLGVLHADGTGRASYRAVFSDLTVAGRHAIVGRAIIIHAKPDDGGQPTGNAGSRIGVGNIAIGMHDN